MTAFLAITSGQWDAESYIDVGLAGQWSNNVIAMFEGDASASAVRLQTAAIANLAVTVAKLETNIKPWILIPHVTDITSQTLWEGLDSTYDEFLLIGNNWHNTVDGINVHLHVATGAPPVTISSSGYTGGAASIHWEIATGVGNAATESMNCRIHLFNLSDTARHKQCMVRAAYTNTAGAITQTDFPGKWASATAVTGLRIDFSGGAQDLGRWKLYGRRK